MVARTLTCAALAAWTAALSGAAVTVPERKDPYLLSDLPAGYFDLVPQEAIEMREVRCEKRLNAAWDFLLTRDAKTAYFPLCGELSNPLSAELWRFDTASLACERLFGVDEVFFVSDREIRPSKIHTSLTELPDGRILMSTHTTARSPRHPFWLFSNYYEHLHEGYAGSHVLIWDPKARVVRDLGIPVKRDSIYGLAYDARHDAIFFTTFLTGELYRMELKSLALKPLGQITELGSYCLFDDRAGGVIASSRSGHVFRIDTETLEIDDLGTVAAEPEPLINWDVHRVIAHHAVAPDGATWFSLHFSNKYYRLDPKTRRLTFVDLTHRDPKWLNSPEALQKGHVFDSKGMMWYFESRESHNSQPGGALHLFRCDVLHGGEVEYMGLVGTRDHAAAIVSEVAIDRTHDVLYFPDGNHGEDSVWYGRIDLGKVAALKDRPRETCRDPFVWCPFKRVPGDEDQFRFKRYCNDHAAFVSGIGQDAVRYKRAVGGRFWERLPFKEDHTIVSARFLPDGRTEFRAGPDGKWRVTMEADGRYERTEDRSPVGRPPAPEGLLSAELPGRSGRRFLAKPTAWGRLADGRWFVGTADSTFALWNPKDGSVYSLGAVGAEGTVAAIGVSGDGKVAYAVCGDAEDLGHVVRYSADRGLEDLGRVQFRNRGEVVFCNHVLTAIAVNGDGTKIAVGTGGRLACGIVYEFER